MGSVVLQIIDVTRALHEQELCFWESLLRRMATYIQHAGGLEKILGVEAASWCTGMICSQNYLKFPSAAAPQGGSLWASTIAVWLQPKRRRMQQTEQGILLR